jgi:hypothetical protein
MRTLAHVSDVLTTTADIGRSIGDAFVWFFLSQSQQFLHDHLRAQPSGYIPVGVGGRGEIEFMRQVRLPHHLVLYHGITSFLRIGDVSFVDTRSLQVVGIGELKTTEVAPRQLSIKLHMVAVRDANIFPIIESIERANTPAEDPSTSKDLPKTAKHRLEKQVKFMSEALKQQPPDSNTDIHDAYCFDELSKMSSRIKTSPHAYQQIGPGLLLIAIRAQQRSFVRRVMTQVPAADIVQRLKGLSDAVIGLFDPNTKPDNRLIIGGVKTTIDAAAVPVFWWSIDLDFAERLYFRELELVTAYNPAHLIGRLRSEGFEVESIENGDRLDYRLSRTLAVGSRVEIGGMWFFLQMIQSHLMKEDKVLEMLLSLIHSANEGTLPSNSRIDLSLVHRVV